MQIRSDKITHFLSGYAIALTVGIWFPPWGLCAGAAAGAAKELIYDKWMGRGTAEWGDFLFTFAGSCLGFAVSAVI